MTMRYSHLVTAHLHEAIAKTGTKLGTRTPERRVELLDQITASGPGAASFGLAPSWSIQVQPKSSYGDIA